LTSVSGTVNLPRSCRFKLDPAAFSPDSKATLEQPPYNQDAIARSPEPKRQGG
jgi:hypothetical protein